LKDLTAVRIVKMLRERHRGNEWACFEELRCGTGYGGSRERRIDLLAINLWPSNRFADGTPRIVAYEWNYAGRELDDEDMRRVAREVFRESHRLNDAEAVQSFKRSTEYQALIELQLAVRDLVGWDFHNAAAFRRWFNARGHKPGIGNLKQHQLRAAIGVLQELLDDQ
jgi:hypothetical protein